MALSLGLVGMEEDDVLLKSLLENLDKLGSESDFGDEENDRFSGF